MLMAREVNFVGIGDMLSLGVLLKIGNGSDIVMGIIERLVKHWG